MFSDMKLSFIRQEKMESVTQCNGDESMVMKVNIIWKMLVYSCWVDGGCTRNIREQRLLWSNKRGHRRTLLRQLYAILQIGGQSSVITTQYQVNITSDIKGQ